MKILNNISTILFDLDNTLITMDEDQFVLSYAASAASFFSDVFPDPQNFTYHLLEGTKYMITTQSDKTNIENFFQYFVPMCGGMSREEIFNRFLEFYTTKFDEIKEIVTSYPIVPKIFEAILKKKIQIVIATDPVFPQIATEKRITWAGLEKFLDKITLVTHGEQFTTTKPHLEYYKQILKIIEKEPYQCLMVGNDLSNDGVSSLLGIKYYQIITNTKQASFLDEERRKNTLIQDIKMIGSGTLEDFYKLLK